METSISHAMGPAGKQNYHYKIPVSHEMGLPANKIVTIKHPFHIQWACRQIKLCHETPISHAMDLPANKILTINSFRTPISHAMGLPANKIITIKHPFHMQWARRQTKLSL